MTRRASRRRRGDRDSGSRCSAAFGLVEPGRPHADREAGGQHAEALAHGARRPEPATKLALGPRRRRRARDSSGTRRFTLAACGCFITARPTTTTAPSAPGGHSPPAVRLAFPRCPHRRQRNERQLSEEPQA